MKKKYHVAFLRRNSILIEWDVIHMNLFVLKIEDMFQNLMDGDWDERVVWKRQYVSQ